MEEIVEGVEPTGFDTRQPFICEVMSGGLRIAKLKFPTDRQWIERVKKQVIFRRDIGRGKTIVDVTPLEKFDEIIFKDRLLEPPNMEFDEYEASAAIEAMKKSEVEEGGGQPAADNTFVIPLVVFGGLRVTHTMRAPRRRQKVDYGTAAIKQVSGERVIETRVSIDQATRIYGDLFVEHSGYAPGSEVPIIHKDKVLVELFRLQDPEA